MFKFIREHRLITQIVLSAAISVGFVVFTYLMQNIPINQNYRYFFLYITSFCFAFTLFYIIFKQEDQLRAEREQLITLFQHVSDGIVILDDEKKIIEMNNAAKELIGEELVADLFCNYCHDSHGKFKICDYEKCFLNHEKVSYYELHLKGRSDRKVPVSVSTSTFLGPDKKYLTIISIRKLGDYRKSERSRINNMITTSIIKAQEEERKRLSRELHDGIGQSIFSVLLGLEYIMPVLQSDDAKSHLSTLRTTTKQTLEEIRNMSVELRPSALDDLGLIAALNSYIKTFGETFGIQINFEYIGDKKRISSSIETALYRITQEALTNAAKYADTDQVDLTINKQDEQILLRITDYGKGFSSHDIENKNKGVGLYSMEERALILNGTFHITSQIGKGTEIEVSIPLNHKGVEVNDN